MASSPPVLGAFANWAADAWPYARPQYMSMLTAQVGWCARGLDLEALPSCSTGSIPVVCPIPHECSYRPSQATAEERYRNKFQAKALQIWNEGNSVWHGLQVSKRRSAVWQDQLESFEKQLQRCMVGVVSSHMDSAVVSLKEIRKCLRALECTLREIVKHR